MIRSVYLTAIVLLNALSIIISVKWENFEQFNYCREALMWDNHVSIKLYNHV